MTIFSYILLVQVFFADTLLEVHAARSSQACSRFSWPSSFAGIQTIISSMNLTESQLSPPTMKAEGIGLQTSRLQKQRSCLLFSACGLVRHEDVSNPMGFHVNLTESQLSPPTMKAEGIGLQTSRLQKQRSCLLFSACGLVRHEDVSNPMGFHVNSEGDG